MLRETAKERLSSFDVVGVTEKFDEFMTAIAVALVSTPPPLVAALHLLRGGGRQLKRR